MRQPACLALALTGLLFRQGVPPHATYLFKHALVQDAAYGTLLREPRRALHARIAETLEGGFPDISENQPEVLARHCTEADLIEKAVGLWGQAALRSLTRSALIEVAEQFTRALNQIGTLPATLTRRREEIKLQVALITPVIHIKGYAAPETKVAIERARLLIEQAQALGEAPEDPLLLYSVLYGIWVAKLFASDQDVCRGLAAQFLAIAEKQGMPVPLMIGHRMMGVTLLFRGDLLDSRAHLTRPFALYDPYKHRALGARFGSEPGVTILCWRSWALWYLGYPEAALADANHAVQDAREIGEAATLLVALVCASWPNMLCGNYSEASSLLDELVALADEKGGALWKAWGALNRGWLISETGEAANAVEMVTSGLTAQQSTGAISFIPVFSSSLARAYANLGRFDDARRSIDEALRAAETRKERMFEAEVNRVAGEIALKSPQPDAAKAEANFERALAVARQQQAKSFELRAAMSLARLWRDQGKVQQARELLAPVYGWFTEGFDTRDLKEAKALLDELSS